MLGIVPPGVYAIPDVPASERIIVDGHNRCESVSTGRGEAITSFFGVGVLCLSHEGYAYINVAKKFSQSSRSQVVRSGMYGPPGVWADGFNPKVIVLADTRHCVFNPSFDTGGHWTGQADDGRTNRRGITILGTTLGEARQVVCLALSNGDAAHYFFDNGTTSRLCTCSDWRLPPPARTQTPEDRERLMAFLDESVVHAIFRQDDTFPHTQLPHAQSMLPR